ncbi:hypothetical protein ISF_02839 [Cordyceps fumosorosea ARSEF 2679]|uniref:Uncharacterized protein n=1 Tax=Cordyceps fumosorosea (strain ARSEF 2679) TaxID=1081104 RepID=A0A162MSG4_CORFA|nr:hypothetical protein ISF_02839 [Cordyceps fumosorosea ARSEF 2679]OAA69569.1 hypothetical protein ISF_02839 [Cordyceps fumosorosea ARSEF 2679]
MGCCASKLSRGGNVDLDKPGSNNLEMMHIFDRSATATAAAAAPPPPRGPEPAAECVRHHRRRDDEAFAEWEEWWRGVTVARAARVRAYTLAERLAGRWDSHVAKTRCAMGVPGCTCYRGVDEGPFWRDGVAPGTGYRCYGIVEREMEGILGPAPVRE